MSSTTKSQTETHRLTVVQIALLLGLAVPAVAIGMWAEFFPRSFFDDFPAFGRAWVFPDGPYNEHLVRDIGGLNLALAAVTIATLWRPTIMLLRITGLAWLLSGVPHLAYHAHHVELLDSTIDKVLEISGLSFVVGAPLALLLMTWNPQSAEDDSIRAT